jgi:peptidoglycan/LPS O-acetylase OafA/YrhL
MSLLVKISYVLCATVLGAIAVAFISSLVITHDQGWDALANFLFFLFIGGVFSTMAAMYSIRYMNKTQLNIAALLCFVILVVVLLCISLIPE